jgi:hypothetical protein
MRLIPLADDTGYGRPDDLLGGSAGLPRAERRRLGESLYHAFEDFTQMQQALCGGATIDEVARAFGLPHHEVARRFNGEPRADQRQETAATRRRSFF